MPIQSLLPNDARHYLGRVMGITYELFTQLARACLS